MQGDCLQLLGISSWLLIPTVFVRIFITVERHSDHYNSYKVKHLIDVVLQFYRLSPLSPQGNMVAKKQTWWQRRNCQFYIFILRPQKETVTHWSDVRVWDLKACLQHDILFPTRSHLLSQGHVSYIAYRPSIQTRESSGVIPIQTTTTTEWNRSTYN